MDYTLIRLSVGELGTNCYILKHDGIDGAVVIDPGDDAEKINAALSEINSFPLLILFTHGHFDHIMALQDLRTADCTVAIHALDAGFLTERDIYSAMLANDPRPFSPADVLFNDEAEKINISGYEFEVIHTPGHTEGSVCYAFDNLLFTGDTLFKNSIGRTDLLGGNNNKMAVSLAMLKKLPRDFTVLPGHGESTTLNTEKENNPFLKLV